MQRTHPVALAPAALICALVLGACGHAAQQGRASGAATLPAAAPAGLAEARASLLAADRAYADSSGRGNLVDGIVRMLAHDGILVTGAGSPVPRGTEAARRYLVADTLRLRSTMTWRPLRADVSADGTRGYSYGFTEVRLPDGSSAPGKYSAFWRREADGSWKVMAYRRGRRAEGPVAAEPPAGFGSPSADRYPSFRPADPAALRDSVDAVERAFSAMAGARGAGAAFAANAAPDGAHFGTGADFAFGPEAIGGMFAEPLPPGQSFSWRPDVVEVAPGGDLAFTTGPIEVQELGPDGVRKVNPPGRYFSIWRRQPDGSWKFVIDG